jgi:hypothetical protein
MFYNVWIERFFIEAVLLEGEFLSIEVFTEITCTKFLALSHAAR